MIMLHIKHKVFYLHINNKEANMLYFVIGLVVGVNLGLVIFSLIYAEKNNR